MYVYAPNPPVAAFAYKNIVNTSNNNYTAVCKFCLLEKRVRFSKTSSSNLIRHLRIAHPLNYDEYVGAKNEKGNKRKENEIQNQSKNDACHLDVQSEICMVKKSSVAKNQDSIERNPCVKLSNDSIRPPDAAGKEAKLFEEQHSESVKEQSPEKDVSGSNISQILTKNDCKNEFKIKTNQSELSFVYKTCSTCQELKTISKCLTLSMDALADNCPHKLKDCCCKQLRATYSNENTLDKVTASLPTSDNSDIFLYQKDIDTKIVKIFCSTCLKAGNLKGGRKHQSDQSWVNGISFDTKRRENQDRKRHLSSSSHLQALEDLNSFDRDQNNKGLPTSADQKRCTENAMTTANVYVNT